MCSLFIGFSFRKGLDTFNFLRHVLRAILSVRPKCSLRCISLKETPLKPVQTLKHTTKNSAEQTSMRTKWFKHIAISTVQVHLLFFSLTIAQNHLGTITQRNAEMSGFDENTSITGAGFLETLTLGQTLPIAPRICPTKPGWEKTPSYLCCSCQKGLDAGNAAIIRCLNPPSLVVSVPPQQHIGVLSAYHHEIPRAARPWSSEPLFSAFWKGAWSLQEQNMRLLPRPHLPTSAILLKLFSCCENIAMKPSQQPVAVTSSLYGFCPP